MEGIPMKPTREKQLRSVKPRTWIMQPWQVRAALDGRLGQLRVPVKPQPPFDCLARANGRLYGCKSDGTATGYAIYKGSPHEIVDQRNVLPTLWCPFGAPGSVVVGKEAWSFEPPRDVDYPLRVTYRADKTVSKIDPDSVQWERLRENGPGENWRPASAMPKWASRFRFRVTAVRVERLQEATEADAVACGYQPVDYGPWWQGYCDAEGNLMHCQAAGKQPPDWMVDPKPYDMSMCNRPALEMMRAEWDAKWCRRKGFPWESSPWCWVVSLEREVQG